MGAGLATGGFPSPTAAVGDIVLSFGNRPTVRRGLRSVRLRQGVIDADVVEAFTHGYCYQLAGALHAEHGWPFALIEHGHPTRPGEWWWTHVGVLTPAGELLDVQGSAPLSVVICHDRPCRVVLRDTVAALHDVMPGHGDVPADDWAATFGELGAYALRRLARDVLSRAGW
jgi:hypothetical protein